MLMVTPFQPTLLNRDSPDDLRPGADGETFSVPRQDKREVQRRIVVLTLRLRVWDDEKTAIGPRRFALESTYLRSDGGAAGLAGDGGAKGRSDVFRHAQFSRGHGAGDGHRRGRHHHLSGPAPARGPGIPRRRDGGGPPYSRV